MPLVQLTIQYILTGNYYGNCGVAHDWLKSHLANRKCITITLFAIATCFMTAQGTAHDGQPEAMRTL